MRSVLALTVIAAACSGDASPDGAADLAGYWVWKEVVDGTTVTTTITDEDMVWKLGPSGWPGCPTGVICTKYGIHVLYVNSDRIHHMHRVVTGSDTQHYGSYNVDGDGLLTMAQEQLFSCAHPRDPATYPQPATLVARVKRIGDDLWITPFADRDPGADAASWIVYRRTTQADAHGKYDHPFCGEAREGGTCHCLCPSQDVLADHRCGD